MRFSESDLLQELLIFDVHLDGALVNVDIYGSRENVCGTVKFTFPDPKDRRNNLAQLRSWMRERTPVSLLAYGETITLLSERALLERCLEPHAQA